MNSNGKCNYEHFQGKFKQYIEHKWAHQYTPTHTHARKATIRTITTKNVIIVDTMK